MKDQDQPLEEASENVLREEHCTVTPRISPNPATNLLFFEVLVGAITRFARNTAATALLGSQFDEKEAKKAAKKRSKPQKLATMAASRIASRSLPGFALVSTGLIAKTLFDRSQNKRKSQSIHAQSDE